MKRKTLNNLLLGLGLVLALGIGIVSSSNDALAQGPFVQGEMGVQAAVGTAFTYQGRLTQGGNPVTGACDFQFSLWDAASGGAQVGSTLTKTNVALTDGYFDAVLDFGAAAFQGDARYLQIAVRCPAGSGGYTALSGRVALNAAPYALSLRPGASVESATGNALNLSTSATSGAALNAIASASSGNAAAVYGSSSSPGGAGLSGYNSSSGHGVYGGAGGSTGTPYGVYGLASHAGSATSYGVYGKSNSSVGTGVGGEAPMNGVYGKATANNGYGVYGEATASSGINYGVYGKAENSSSGVGVYGKGAGGKGVYGEAGTGVGVYGRSLVTGTAGIALLQGVGVYGEASATSGTTYGVYGKAASLSGKGVYGEGGYFGVQGIGTDPSGTSYGVYGKTDSTAAGSYGGYFRADHNVGLYAMGYDSSRTGGDIRLAGNYGTITADENSNSIMSLVSNDDVWVYLDNNNDDASSCFSVFDPGFSSIVAFWEVCHPTMASSGAGASIVNTQDFGARKLYAMESSEVRSEDFGTDTLVNGLGTVSIDPVFAETVNLEEYHVFLTPLGDCNGLYVASKTSTSFEVRELGGGTSNISFDYRIVARRLGFEGTRLEEVRR